MTPPFATLTQELILDASELFGLVPNHSIYPLNSYENRVYFVGLEQQQPVVCKIYRPQRWSYEQIQEELDFICELAADEQAVIEPIKFESKHILHHKGFYFAFWPLKSGQPIELANPEHLYLVGMKLGRLHQAAKRRAFQYRPKLDLLTKTQLMCEQMRTNPFIPEYLHPEILKQCLFIVERCKEKQTLFNQCRSIRVHGDLHAGNILIRDQEVIIVDFDDSVTAPAISDIWMLLSGNQQEQQLQLSEILEGYEIFCEFDRKELSLIPYLQTLRILQHPVWISDRWEDPAFKKAFADIEKESYWQHLNHVLAEQILLLQA